MKHFMTLLFLIALLISTNSKAQNLEDSNLELLEANSKSSSQFDAKIKETDKDLLIDLRDSGTGVDLGQYNTNKDASRYSFLLNLNAKLTSLTSITAFEFSYAKKLEIAWMEFFISRMSAVFSEVTTKNDKDFNLNAFSDEDLDLNNSSLLSLGGGLNYRTSFIQNLINSDRVFETIAAHITLNQFSESLTAIKYSGFGIRTDFGLHYRTNESFHIGGKLSYNLSTVRRSSEIDFNPETVTSAERSLTLSWISLGFDVSYYY